jgi:hypothetical protein
MCVDDVGFGPSNRDRDMRANVYGVVRCDTRVPLNSNAITALAALAFLSRIGSEDRHFVTAVDEPFRDLTDVCLHTTRLRGISRCHL